MRPLPNSVFLWLVALVLGTGVSVGLWYSTAALKVVVVNDSPILGANPTASADFLGDAKGSSLRGYEVSVRNTGTTVITPRDVELPIVIRSRSGAHFLAAEMRDAPPGSDFKVEIVGERLTILPTLLNPGESVTLAFVTTGEAPDDLEATGRVAGVREITLMRPLKKTIWPLVTGELRWYETALYVAAPLSGYVILIALTLPALRWSVLELTRTRPRWTGPTSELASQIALLTVSTLSTLLVALLRGLPEIPRWIGNVSALFVVIGGLLILVSSVGPILSSNPFRRPAIEAARDVIGIDLRRRQRSPESLFRIVSVAPPETTFSVIGFDQDADLEIQAQNGDQSMKLWADSTWAYSQDAWESAAASPDARIALLARDALSSLNSSRN